MPTVRCWPARCCRWRCPRWCGRTGRSGSGSRYSTASAIRAGIWRTRWTWRWKRSRAPTSRSSRIPGRGLASRTGSTSTPASRWRCTKGSTSGSPTSTVRLDAVDAAYWTRMGEREFLRWVLPHDEDAVLDGLARLHAAGEDRLLDDSRLIGSFRAYGLIVPVWEFPGGTGGAPLEEPVKALSSRLDAAL